MCFVKVSLKRDKSVSLKIKADFKALKTFKKKDNE